jgi:hypothetical protein
VSDLIAIARQFLAARSGEKGDKGEKPCEAPPPFSPLSPFYPAAGDPPRGASLTGFEVWDEYQAGQLIEGVEALVAGLDVGDRPELRDAAVMVAAARGTRDMETVRFACSEVVAVARGLSGRVGARSVTSHKITRSSAS